MTNAEAIKVLLRELQCIERNDGVQCNRKCESCDLVMDAAVLKDAYNMAIKALKEQEWIPVKERLPEKPNMYTVTDSKGDVVRFGCKDVDVKLTETEIQKDAIPTEYIRKWFREHYHTGVCSLVDDYKRFVTE